VVAERSRSTGDFFSLEEHVLYKHYDNKELTEISIDKDDVSSIERSKKEKHKFSFGFNMDSSFKRFD